MSEAAELEYVRVSQGSRRDAHVPVSVDEESYEEKQSKIKRRLKEIDGQLSTLGKAGLQKEQARLRRLYSGNRSFAEYMTIKAEFESRRQALVKEKQSLEAENIRLNPLARSERIRANTTTAAPGEDVQKLVRDDGSVNYGIAAMQIIELLSDIKDGIDRLIKGGAS